MPTTTTDPCPGAAQGRSTEPGAPHMAKAARGATGASSSRETCSSPTPVPVSWDPPGSSGRRRLTAPPGRLGFWFTAAADSQQIGWGSTTARRAGRPGWWSRVPAYSWTDPATGGHRTILHGWAGAQDFRTTPVQERLLRRSPVPMPYRVPAPDTPPGRGAAGPVRHSWTGWWHLRRAC
jgi:hypothetical protein